MEICKPPRKLLIQKDKGDFHLQLWEHIIKGKKEYELVINGVFIMASYNGYSSELLIRNAIHKLEQSDISVLVGGLGMGYTVKEACKYPKIKSIDVVEIVTDVILWNKEFLLDCNEGCLSDPRVKIIQNDFYDYVIGTNKRYDLICMDIDNGPSLIVNEGNNRAYGVDFFNRVKQIMNVSGMFVIWSCSFEEILLERMKKVFTQYWSEEVFEEYNGHNIPYYLYYGRRKK